jgi:hypothetical protein
MFNIKYSDTFVGIIASRYCAVLGSWQNQNPKSRKPKEKENANLIF